MITESKVITAKDIINPLFGTNNIPLAMFQILIGFLIVDKDIEDCEEDKLMDFLMERFDDLDKQEFSLARQIEIISEDEDNFARNALFLNIALTNEKKIDLLMYISETMLADKEFSDEEYDLYNKLLYAWKIESIQDLKK